MWSTNFSPSKLTELLRYLPKFAFIKNLENCSNVQYLRKIERYNEGRPHFGILIRSSIFFLMHFMSFINYRKSNWRYSSRLSICMFNGTPCSLQRIKRSSSFIFLNYFFLVLSWISELGASGFATLGK